MENSIQLPQKTKNRLQDDPAIPTLGMHLNKRTTPIQKDNTPQCSYQHYLQLPRYGSNLHVHQQMNG